MPRSFSRIILLPAIIGSMAVVSVPSSARAQLFGPDPQLIRLTLPLTVTAVVGQRFTITVSAQFASVGGGPSTPRQETTLAWYAGNPLILKMTTPNTTLPAGTYSATAEMIALAAGRTTVRVSFGSIEANATIDVVAATGSSAAAPARLAVAPQSGTLVVARALQLTATVWNTMNVVLTGHVIAWSSNAPAVATVTANGLVTAIAPGTAVIRAMDGAVGNTAVVVVQSAPPVIAPPVVVPVATVSVAPEEVTIKIGLPLRLTASVRDANGASLTGRVITWMSSAPAIARVSTDGQVTGAAPGTATVTATSDGQRGSATVTVVRVTRLDP